MARSTQDGAPSDSGVAATLGALRGCRLWRGASDEAVAHLATRSHLRTLKRGELLFSEGDASDELAVIVQGTASVYHLGANGRKIAFEQPGAGEPVAAVASLAGSRMPAYVEAATPMIVALLPRSALLELLESEPAVARALVADLARRVVHFTSVVQSFTLDIPQRLARYLFQRSLAAGRATPDGLLVPLGMSKGELAGALGTVPETLSRAFARLRDDGVIEPRGKDVLVLDVGALARLGEGLDAR